MCTTQHLSVHNSHQYVSGHLKSVEELLSYLSMNINQRPPALTTISMDPDDPNQHQKSKNSSVRQTLRMRDSEIIAESKGLIKHLIEFIDYFDDDQMIASLGSVVPPKDLEEDKEDEEVDRLDLNYWRSICYTNLASLAMLEQDFENVMDFACKALDSDLKNAQSHRYFITGLMATLYAYNANDIGVDTARMEPDP